MAIVWRCRLSVDEYVAAGKAVAVPRPHCPECAGVMRFRSGYWRHLRAGGGVGRPAWIRRAQCRPCRRSHALVPSLLLQRRLDTVADIGAVVEAVVAGSGRLVRLAADLHVPTTTARDWVRRFRARAPVLAAGLTALAVVVGAGAGIAALPTEPARRALGALALVSGVAASSPSSWAAASLVTGGALLATTTDPPWTVLGDRRFMPPVP